MMNIPLSLTSFKTDEQKYQQSPASATHSPAHAPNERRWRRRSWSQIHDSLSQTQKIILFFLRRKQLFSLDLEFAVVAHGMSKPFQYMHNKKLIPCDSCGNPGNKYRYIKDNHFGLHLLFYCQCALLPFQIASSLSSFVRFLKFS